MLHRNPTPALPLALASALNRTDLIMQVAGLEAQLKLAGDGVEREKADMEAVLVNLSNALSDVEVQLKQSAVRAANAQNKQYY